MTYCVGLRVEAGLVIVADTRTNAGIDNISTYKKLHILADDEERLIVVASAGSLSVSQSMLSMLMEGLSCLDDSGLPRSVSGQPTMFRVAQLVGEALSTARRAIGQTLEGTKINANASILLGGRIGNAPLSLYQIYAEGNFIECQPDAPFLQIGELKYGKPILDRALTWESPLEEAVKVVLMSFDSTMRSNLSVGLPIDVLVYPANSLKSDQEFRIEEDDAYFRNLHKLWNDGLKQAIANVPAPTWNLPAD